MGDLGSQEKIVKDVGEGDDGEGMDVMDFDLLCSTVALQTQSGYHWRGGGNWEKLNDADDEIDGGGFNGRVQRMWEGDVLDCFQDRRIALETICCPCYRFGKSMGRAGFGPSFVQAVVYFILIITTVSNFIAFAVIQRRRFLYMAVAFTILSGLYFGFFLRQIRKQFNIRGSESSMDDCITHLICPCCTLCQESRTLEINNVRDGIWRGRGDTLCIGSHGVGSKEFVELHQTSLIPTKNPENLNMQRASKGVDHSWSVDVDHLDPLVPSSQL